MAHGEMKFSTEMNRNTNCRRTERWRAEDGEESGGERRRAEEGGGEGRGGEE